MPKIQEIKGDIFEILPFSTCAGTDMRDWKKGLFTFLPFYGHTHGDLN